MALPQSLLQSLEGLPGFDREAFESVHRSGEQITSVRINPLKMHRKDGEWPVEQLFAGSEVSGWQQVPWSDTGIYLPRRPSFTFDPLFHAGCYYVQEASSMFLEQALRQAVDLQRPLRVLDLCAAPGGKSTHLQSLISPDSLLVSNEVIKSRAGILRQNITKWGGSNVIVTNSDPQYFSKLEGFFDLIVVDAPCSGSGLFRRDEDAIAEWSPENVQLCCGRQKRILADVLPALKEGGLLVYSTCSYSRQEDEDIADWLVQEAPMKSEPLQIDASWGVVESRSPQAGAAGYRFYPDQVKGEGFFLACMRKTSGESTARFRTQKPEKASARERALIEPWLSDQRVALLKDRAVFALPEAFLEDWSILKAAVYVQYAGVAIGEIMKEKLVPDHALALSNLVAAAIPRIELSYADAIRYLQKQDIHPQTGVKGWQMVTFQGYPLGWVNVLHNRTNNYYPKELRILKQT